ncbi:hypothetical protein BC938DRAFT_475254 [Jimgerdemannia flammicorona]|uniref:Response regulatory domain-containing protein n=1 Tax=Jimgerdemannia flammicorona TaxID=994334 RepID=A0A433QRU7_9FUNG|nr:hypothetical protein BC938DRAFT_475254 [Jimgerdemannia flammicorona]
MSISNNRLARMSNLIYLHSESRSPEAAEPFDIYVTMQRISEVVAIVVDRKKLDFCLDFSIPFKHNLVFGNGSALEQTFVNLLGNSIELTRSGTITLSATSGEVISSGSSSSGEFVAEKVPFRFVVCSTGDVSQVADPDENILSKNNTDNEGYVEVGLRVAETVLSHMAGNLRVEFSRSEITHDGTLQFIIEISFRAVYDNSFPYDPIENTPIPHRYLPAEFRNLLGRVRNTRFAFYDPTQESQSDVHIRDLKVAKQWLDEFAAPTLMVANIEDLDETSVLVMESSVELEAQNPLNRVRGKNICIVCITRISKSVDVSLALRTELTENRIKIVAKPVTRVKFWMSVLELMKLSHEDSKRKSSDNEGSFQGQGGESPDEGSPQTRGEVFSFEGSVQDQDATQNDKEPIDVLIVEENEINKLILIKYLEGHEYTFHITSNGGEVVEKFHKNSYRVVLMGIEIPVRDAINSVKELRKYENLARLGIDKPRKVDRAKIIMMMAEINHRRDRAMQAGCDDILQKPLSFNDLREKMPLWLPKSDRK